MRQPIRMIAPCRKFRPGWLLAAFLLSGLPAVASTDAGERDLRGEQTLDPTRPMPRDLVLETLRQKLALPAEDQINWEEAVAAGRIPRNVQILRDYLVARGAELDWDEVGPPPSITLPGGEELYGLHLALFGPNLGANLTQEDLNAFIPKLAEAQRRVNKVGQDFRAPDPRLAADAPLAGLLGKEDFAVTRAYPSERPGTVAQALVRRSPDGTEFAHILFVEPDPVVHGAHIRDAIVLYRDGDRASVQIWLNQEGRRNLTAATEDPEDLMLALFVEGDLVSAPTVRAQVTGGSLEIPSLSQPEAVDLVNHWKSAEAHRELQLAATGPVNVLLWEAMHGSYFYTAAMEAGDEEKIHVPADRPVRIEFSEAGHLEIRMSGAEEKLLTPEAGGGHFFLPGRIDRDQEENAGPSEPAID